MNDTKSDLIFHVIHFLRMIFDNRYRERWELEQKKENEKKLLIQQMKSQDNLLVRKAIDSLRSNQQKEHKDFGEINDRNVFEFMGLMQWTYLGHEDFAGANWQEVDISGLGFRLTEANLRTINLAKAVMNDTVLDGAILDDANLCQAMMKEVHLLGAKLRRANLQGANLELAHAHGADFCNADMSNANLVDIRMHETNLMNVNFRNSDLHFADFTHANLEGAIFDDAVLGREWHQGMSYSIKLPDGSQLTTPGDFDRFTHRHHPNFWRPKIPVYWGDGENIQKHDDISALDLDRNSNY